MLMYSNGPTSIIVCGSPRAPRFSSPWFSSFVDGEFDYVRHRFSVVADEPLAPASARWIAPFATNHGVVFVPVLQAVGGEVDSVHVGQLLESRSLGDHKVLIVGDGRVRQFSIAGNTEDRISLHSRGDAYTHTAGDVVIVAPEREFALLPLLKLEAGARGNREWRNWVFDGLNTIQSYTGNPFGNITTALPAWQELNFADYISPLATAVVGSIQAFTTTADELSAALYVSRDSSNHVLSFVSLDRSAVSGSGMTAPFSAGFGIGKRLWCATNDVRVVGRLTITGWKE